VRIRFFFPFPTTAFQAATIRKVLPQPSAHSETLVGGQIVTEEEEEVKREEEEENERMKEGSNKQEKAKRD